MDVISRYWSLKTIRWPVVSKRGAASAVADRRTVNENGELSVETLYVTVAGFCASERWETTRVGQAVFT